MVKLGVILFASTLAVLVAEFLRRRTRAYPAYGWIGLVCLAVSEWLMFRGLEPMATFFTPIAWTCYALIADAAVFAIRGRSRMRNSPRQFAKLALLSIPLWLIFEAYNLRLANWTYVGAIALPLPIAWLAYAWAFATIWPGIFLTADLIEAYGWWDRPFRPIRFSRTTQNAFMLVGAALVIVPVILPARRGSYLFGAVWVGFVFLLDPINFRLRLPSFEADLSAGRPGPFFSFLVSGWVCGWLWEFWNYWASAKWNYTFPIMQGGKIFEMPALGYLGFLPFALECFVMYYLAAWIIRWERPLRRPIAESQPRTTAAVLRSWPLVLAFVLISGLTGAQPAHASSLHCAKLEKIGGDALRRRTQQFQNSVACSPRNQSTHWAICWERSRAGGGSPAKPAKLSGMPLMRGNRPNIVRTRRFLALAARQFRSPNRTPTRSNNAGSEWHLTAETRAGTRLT